MKSLFRWLIIPLLFLGCFWVMGRIVYRTAKDIISYDAKIRIARQIKLDSLGLIQQKEAWKMYRGNVNTRRKK